MVSTAYVSKPIQMLAPKENCTILTASNPRQQLSIIYCMEVWNAKIEGVKRDSITEGNPCCTATKEPFKKAGERTAYSHTSSSTCNSRLSCTFSVSHLYEYVALELEGQLWSGDLYLVQSYWTPVLCELGQVSVPRFQ